MTYASLKNVSWISSLLFGLSICIAALWADEAHPSGSPKVVKKASSQVPLIFYKVPELNRAPSSELPFKLDQSGQSNEAYNFENNLFNSDWNSKSNFLDFHRRQSNESVLLGKSISQAFKEHPFYVPTSFVIYRFKSN